MTREEAVEKVIEEDYKLDRKMLMDFLDFTGVSKEEFWSIVDKFANQEILEKRGGHWRLKPEVVKCLIEGGEV